MERKAPLRDRGKPRTRWDYPIDSIRQWIAEGKTQAWIGQQLGVSGKLIYKVCKKHGIECQRTGPRNGPGHPEWKGGRIIDKHGYVLLYRPGHPRARRPRRIYVLEHILVMEKILGRPLRKGEIVHHRNKNRQDNRPENLALYGSNAGHLRDELTGNCPNWTEEGKARLRQTIQQLADNRRGLKASEYLSKQRTLRSQDEPCTTVVQTS